MLKRTPGEWIVEENDNVEQDGWRVVSADSDTTGEDYTYFLVADHLAERDAHLCAAAPSLLAACETALERLEHYGTDCASATCLHCRAVAQLRAAIAAATGEERDG